MSTFEQVVAGFVLFFLIWFCLIPFAVWFSHWWWMD